MVFLLQMQDNFVALRNNRKSIQSFVWSCLRSSQQIQCHVRVHAVPTSEIARKPAQAPPSLHFGGTVLVAPPPSKAEAITGRFAYGSYLGPVLGKASHWASIQVKPGVVEIVQSPAVKMLLPVRYDLELLGMLAKRSGSIVHRPPLLPDIDRVDDELTVFTVELD